MATNATAIVPFTNGKTPKCCDAKSGVHRVPVKKSRIGTSPKNWMVSPNKVITIPVVVSTDTAAHANSTQ